MFVRCLIITFPPRKHSGLQGPQVLTTKVAHDFQFVLRLSTTALSPTQLAADHIAVKAAGIAMPIANASANRNAGR
jgi:hypothetical protein